MNTYYTGKIGLVKVREANSNRNIVSNCWGRLLVPAAALEEIELQIGQAYTIRATENDHELVIKKSSNVKSQRLAEARTVNFQNFHFLRFHALTCRIASQDLELTELNYFMRDGDLIAQLPAAVILVHTVEDAERRQAEKEERLKYKPSDFRDAIAGLRGAAAALALDSWRYDMNEPSHVCRRLQLLSRRSHYEQDDEQICTRGSGTRDPHGVGS